MSKYAVIENPLNFLNETYLKAKVLIGKYSKSIPTVLYKNEYPKTIFIEFPDESTQSSFIGEYNNSFFEPNFSFKLSIKSATNFDIENSKNLLASTGDDNNNNNKILKYYFNYEKMVFNDYENTWYEPGLIYLDEVEKAKIERGVKWWLGKIGSNILKGQAIMTISLPVFLFDKRTWHEVFAYQHKGAPYYLTHAFHCEEKYERIKWMVVYLVSQWYLSTFQTKPFNPLIGETFQCKIGDWNIYTEQTSNHPISYNFYCFDDNRNYTISGYIITSASTGTNSISAMQKGEYRIRFKDGGDYSFHLPGVYIKGITIGKRLYNYCDKCLVVDNVNKICAYIQMNPDSLGYLSSWFTSKQATSPDTFRGSVVKLEEVTISQKDLNHVVKDNATNFMQIKGEWTNELSFDDDVYWRVDDNKLWDIKENGYKLPSDGRLREDYIEWINNNEEKSQECKEKLENKQREDRKLRAKFAKK